jgi:predicted Zn-dependent protease
MDILARAGYDLASTPNVWRRMAAEHPGSIKMAQTHPTTAERFIRLQATREESEKKKANHMDLMPEKKARGK